MADFPALLCPINAAEAVVTIFLSLQRNLKLTKQVEDANFFPASLDKGHLPAKKKTWGLDGDLLPLCSDV